eukprot:COSAG06_NODE_44230_length_365_cov_0.781955_1_plen_73_part_01
MLHFMGHNKGSCSVAPTATVTRNPLFLCLREELDNLVHSLSHVRKLSFHLCAFLLDRFKGTSTRRISPRLGQG